MSMPSLIVNLLGVSDNNTNIRPERKFSMISRFCIHLESESEAQRLVRTLHMTPYKNQDGAPTVKAEIIY